jgi:hypothetical protein
MKRHCDSAVILLAPNKSGKPAEKFSFPAARLHGLAQSATVKPFGEPNHLRVTLRV